MDNNNNINNGQPSQPVQPVQPVQPSQPIQPVQQDSQVQYQPQPAPAPYQPEPAPYQPQPDPALYQQQAQYQQAAQYQPAPAPYQQPVQYQQPAQYQQNAQYQQPAGYQPQVPVQPYMAQTPIYPVSQETEEQVKAKEKNKKGNILCFISLGLQIIPYILTGILGGITDSFNNLTSNDTSMTVLTEIMSAFVGGSYIASWVFMIIARVKYKNTFSKVLMWVYIGIMALSIVAVVVVIAMCWFMCKDCNF